MKSIYQHISELKSEDWDYYYDLSRCSRDLKNPFSSNYTNHNEFIEQYIQKSGKIDVLKKCDITISELRKPEHITSVFFLGILFNINTSILNKYKELKNDPGYDTFTFLWFLTALFHDFAYQIENDSSTTPLNGSFRKIKNKYKITNDLLLKDKSASKCKILLGIRNEYFKYRLREDKNIDHGIMGGVLIYDRLVKIRKEKEKINEDTLFWGQNLEAQYELAADIISIHNIWVNQKRYYNTKLEVLNTLPPVKCNDFPLFYLLAIIDTIEPIKLYKETSLNEKDILNNLYIEFLNNGFILKCNKQILDFHKLLKKIVELEGWLDITIKIKNENVTILFN